MKRIVVLEFYQETNSFNPAVMTWDRFESCSVAWGSDVPDKASADSAVAGLRAALAAHSGQAVETVFIGSMIGLCGGPVAEDVIDELWRRIVSAVRALPTPPDGVAALLHGACASPGRDDVEGWMLERLRALVGDVPMVVGLDHHANITRKIMQHADAIVGYRSEPHYPYETGFNVTRILLSMLGDDLRPAMAWRKIPMITPMDQFETSAGPMKDLFDLARAAERGPGVLSVSPFPMQPWLDVAEGGWSIVSVTDGTVDPDPIAAEIANAAWDTREAFWKTSGVPVGAALSSASALSSAGLVVLHDTGDSVFAGSSGASVAMLEALLAEPEAAGIISIVAPRAVAQAYEAGPGQVIDVAIGDDPVYRAVLELPAVVKGLAEGPVTFAPFYALTSVDEGRSALLGIGRHLVNVTERAVFGGNDPKLYERYGVDPGSVRFAVVKIAADYDRFHRWRTGKVRVNSPGCSQHDLAVLPWRRLPRPLFGLDEGVAWRA